MQVNISATYPALYLAIADGFVQSRSRTFELGRTESYFRWLLALFFAFGSGFRVSLSLTVLI